MDPVARAHRTSERDAVHARPIRGPRGGGGPGRPLRPRESRLARRDPRRARLTFRSGAGWTQPRGGVRVGSGRPTRGEIFMKLGTSTKATALADQWRASHNAKRIDRLDEENDRLRAELRMTRSQLEREREREQDVLDALNRASERKTKVTAKPRAGLLRLVIVGGAAYVFGTKAGRDRYEQIRGWVSSMKIVSPMLRRHVVARHRTEGEPAHGERGPAEDVRRQRRIRPTRFPSGSSNSSPRTVRRRHPRKGSCARAATREPHAPPWVTTRNALSCPAPRLSIHARCPVSDAFGGGRRGERRPRRATPR